MIEIPSAAIAATIGLATGGIAVVAVLSPENITAMTVAIGALVTAVAVGIVNVITARSAAAERARQTVKIDQTLIKTNVIEGHVNSEKSRMTGALTVLEKENALLREMLVDKKQTAGLLAQAAATQRVTIPTQAPSPVLNKIEKNTADTADNTTRTDAAVQAIKQDQTPP